MNFLMLQLGTLLDHNDETIRRNAQSILKQLQRAHTCQNCGELSELVYEFRDPKADRNTAPKFRFCRDCVKDEQTA